MEEAGHRDIMMSLPLGGLEMLHDGSCFVPHLEKDGAARCGSSISPGLEFPLHNLRQVFGHRWQVKVPVGCLHVSWDHVDATTMGNQGQYGKTGIATLKELAEVSAISIC